MSHQFEISIDEIAAFVPMLWASNLTPMIWGPPGVGKSESIYALAKQGQTPIPENEVLSGYSEHLRNFYGKTFDYRKIFDVRLLLLNPTDLSGIPVYNKDDREALWVQTGLFPAPLNILREMERRLASKFAEIEALGWSPEEKEVSEARIADRKKRGLGPESPEARMVREIASVQGLDDLGHQRLARSWDQIMHLEQKIGEALMDQHSIVFLDEISIAPKMVQGAALQLVLDRSCGTYKLPDGVGLVAAGNRVSDGVGARPMSPALSTRFEHVQISDPTFKGWEPWARENGIDPVILGFLNFRPESIFKFDVRKLMGTGADSAVTCPTPRTWSMVSRFIKKNGGIRKLYETNLGKRLTASAISGLVGPDQVYELNAFVEIYRLLPDPEDIFSGNRTSVDYIELLTEEDRENDMISGPKTSSLKYAFITNLFAIFNDDIKSYGAQKIAEVRPSDMDQIADRLYARLDTLAKFLLADEDDVEWANVFYFRVLNTSFKMLDYSRLKTMESFQKLLEKAAEVEAHNGRHGYNKK